MVSNREKCNIAIAILAKLPFLKGTKKNILHFGGSNNIFADCINLADFCVDGICLFIIWQHCFQRLHSCVT